MSATNGTAVAQRDTTPLAKRDPLGLASHFFESGYFSDTKSLSQAVVKMVAGEELGLGPMTSMQGLHIIQGKPTISANLMASKVKMSDRYDYRVREDSATKCRIEWFEDDESVGFSEYTIEQAQRAGLASKDNWKKTPEDMLFARTISRGVRRFCPDVLAGTTAYVPEELGVEVDGNGEPIHVEQPEPQALPEEADESAASDDPEPEAVDAEVVEDGTAISKAEAGRIYESAVGTDAIDPEQFAQAVGFVIEADPGDMSKKGKAVEVLSAMTEQQAERIKGWIEKKAGTGQEGNEND